ncbi:MAG: tryptophan--tRNA ligase [Candidatus Aenigmarchaeota archaeon]|nr:tryptophan--tRNA ligase [Candidatus Aenigmarchaeota archaeon]
MAEMIVTPWEVKGEIDYDKLLLEFGLKRIDEKLKKRLQKKLGDNIFLRRGIFFAHRDLDWLLDEYDKKNYFYLYTGRGPSGHTHLGHLLPWIFTKELQDAYNTKLVFQLTDDEKFLFSSTLSVGDVEKFTNENILDIIAVGFDPKKTEIYTDMRNAKDFYPQAVRVAKHITFSTAKAVFGFENDSNIGKIFFTSMQAVPAFIESVNKGKNVPCLIPHAIDQDPHFRVTRDILPKLGYYKPSSIQCKFIPGLGKDGKMSSSEPETCIFTIDTSKDIERKIKKAFTGGRESLEEQKKLGGNPDICPIYQYFYNLFEEDDEKLEDRFRRCKNGKLMCGECKQDLIPRVQKFMKEHQERREKAKKLVSKFLVK